MRSIHIASSLLWCLTASAMPALKLRSWSYPHGKAPASTSSFGVYDKASTTSDSCNCDLSQASMPSAPTPLPSPPAGLSLAHVAIGRGTQNYTCDLSNSTAVPVAIGAYATLFNVSCLAVQAPGLVSLLPQIAIDLPMSFTPSPEDATSSPMYFDTSGYHYFTNTTTAFFNLDTSTHTYGSGAFKKVNATTPPTTAIVGPEGSGNGAVPWLKLNADYSESKQVLQQVYRLNTAGGNPPKTCQGMTASFEVPYAAEYWIYT